MPPPCARLAQGSARVYKCARLHHDERMNGATIADVPAKQEQILSERFERHRQPWTYEELEKLKLLAKKGMALKAISKAMTRSEESIKDRAKLDGIGIAKLR